MAIRDLLWACPLCGTVGAIARAGKLERCTTCGARFRRVQGARIEVRRPDGRTETRPAGEWAALLPAEPLPPQSSGRAGEPGEGQGGEAVRRDRVLARFAVGDEAIRHRGRFIGVMERFGPERPGRLALSAGALELVLEDGETHRWALDDVAALQASSRTVQLRPRGQAIVSFAFPDSSARLWEESIGAALRRRWRESGRGEIVEFQPRIVARPAQAPADGPPDAASSPRGPAAPSSPGEAP